MSKYEQLQTALQEAKCIHCVRTIFGKLCFNCGLSGFNIPNAELVDSLLEIFNE